MKIGLLKITSTNRFVGMDHEDHYTHLAILYEKSQTIRMKKNKKQICFRDYFHAPL